MVARAIEMHCGEPRDRRQIALTNPTTLGSTSVSEEANLNKDQTAAAAARPVTEATDQPKLSSSTKKDVLLYGLARLLLFVVLTALIHGIVMALGMAHTFPLLMSALLALILALPLSMLLFRKLRLRVNREIANWDADRRAHKEQMRRQLQERLD